MNGRQRMCYVAASDRSDLRIVHLNEIGSHYATTLAHWRERFFDSLSEVRTLGLPSSFIRMWEFYLCYCEAGFAKGLVSIVQVLITHENGCTDIFPHGSKAV
jgi:cyclopropane-fatty-acyl-phospholipid synthase